MTTFLDTSALLSAINQHEKHHGWSVAQIARRRAEGPLIIADIVYSELSAGMKSREETDKAIQEWALERIRNSDDALFRAGQAYMAYRKKKRGPGESVKSNVLPDFLIGALAESDNVPLVTTNEDDFLKYFPNIKIISPTIENLPKNEKQDGEEPMAINHRIFTAFAIEDKWAKEYLVGQAKNEKSTFEFTDMAAKEPWDEEWKKKCRSRIKGCDGVIALVSKNTAKASGQLWEIRTAKEEGIPIIGIYTTTDDRPTSLSAELSGVTVKAWTWANISAFLATL